MDEISQQLRRTDISAMSGKIVVAAIDFGTTFSGWSYSFKHDFSSDPTKIYAKNWNNGTNISTKAPTTVLIRPDGKTFEAFGYEAEDKYALLSAEGKHREWYYFSRFKMMLYNKLNIGEDTLLEDASGKQLLAKDVFKHAIAFLREDLKLEYSKRLADVINDSEVMWVLTVPAIWNAMAKRFMRQAAVEAGIPDSCLKIALEPEAASLYCKMLALKKKEVELDISSFSPGATYMVLDAGGGTIDVSVHQVLDDGTLRELHKASGGAWGGTRVDEAYIQLLIKIFGTEVFNKFKNENMDDYIDILRTFEVRKRNITSENDTIISLPATLVDTFTEENGGSLKTAISHSIFSELITAEKGNKLRIKASLMRKLYSETVDSTVKHISELLQKRVVADVKTILMVGGLSDCKCLHDAVQQSFRNVKVIVPAEAALVVLKGAVVFGYQPTAIVERVLQYTYGVAASIPFQDGVHPLDKLVILNGRRQCKGIFRIIVECEQSINLNGQIALKRPLRSNETNGVTFMLFGSTSKSPIFVKEKNCFKVGELRIKFDDDIPENLEKSFKLYGYFGEPEIHFSAEDVQTGKTYSAEFQLPKEKV